MHDVTALENAFSHHEGYMPHGEQLHAVDRTLEYSRPLRALKLWLAFTVHGADAIRNAIERNLDEARLLRTLIEADPRFELLTEPQLSTVCFRHVPPPGADSDAHNTALARAIAADGRILLAPAEIDGATALRACFVNHRTSEDDVRAIPAVIADLASRA